MAATRPIRQVTPGRGEGNNVLAIEHEKVVQIFGLAKTVSEDWEEMYWWLICIMGRVPYSLYCILYCYNMGASVGGCKKHLLQFRLCG